MRHDKHFPRSCFSLGSLSLSGLLIATFSGLGACAAGARVPGEVGVWFNESKRGAVEIRPCGDGRLCGYIVWLRKPHGKNDQPLIDANNPKSTHRRRPICGLPVLGSLRAMSDGSWDRGWVYDPEEGKSYDAAIKLTSHNQIIMTGYKGVKMFSKSFVWTRAPADLQRCDKKAIEQREVSIPAGNAELPPIPIKASLARASRLPPLIPPRPIPAVRRRAVGPTHVLGRASAPTLNLR